MALLFPTTLFKDIYKFINKNEVIILCEEPFYFNFKFHPYKLILHRASMKQFHEYLKSLGYSVVYINHDRFSIREIKKINIKVMIDPIDKPMISRYTKLFPNIVIIDNLGFINSRNNLTNYYNEINEKGGRPFLNKNFFEWNKKQFDILKNVDSYDQENRNPIPDGIKIPRLPKLFRNNICNGCTKALNAARNYIDTDKKTNLDNFVFPINHKQAKKMLSDFIKYRFKNFGKYQDAIIPEESYLFHSVLSSSLNIGLITANEVITAVEKAKGTPIQSKEGFIRQILGWREYIRFCYLFNYEEYNNNNFQKLNYFNNKGKLTKSWYTGTTGIPIVDETIKKAFNHAYLHHIERLMIMANIMNLAEIAPAEIYKWFMEFAIDSYEWVMIPNVFGMGTYADGGNHSPISTKPYISSSNYIVNMSSGRVKRDPIWDALYYAFVIKHKKKVKYNYSILRDSIARKSASERQKITLTANKFKEINT